MDRRCNRRPLGRGLGWLVLPALVACAPVDPPPPGGVGHGARGLIGGDAAGEGLAAVGALVRDDGEGARVYCSGTLIADRLVLTAAHCLTRPPADAWLGFVANPGGPEAAPGAAIPVLSRVPHGDFVEEPPPVLSRYHDIGLAELAWAPDAPPAPLVGRAEAEILVVAGRGVLIAGCGLGAAGDATSLGPKRSGVTSVAEVAPTELRIWGAPDPQRCAGDSGGPSFGDLDEGQGLELRLIGVASRAGEGCTGGSAETRVDAYAGWIETQATALGCDLDDRACAPPVRWPSLPRLEPIPIVRWDAEVGGEGGCAVATGAPPPLASLLTLLSLVAWLARRRRERYGR